MFAMGRKLRNTSTCGEGFIEEKYPAIA